MGIDYVAPNDRQARRLSRLLSVSASTSVSFVAANLLSKGGGTLVEVSRHSRLRHLVVRVSRNGRDDPRFCIHCSTVAPSTAHVRCLCNVSGEAFPFSSRPRRLRVVGRGQGRAVPSMRR